MLRRRPEATSSGWTALPAEIDSLRLDVLGSKAFISRGYHDTMEPEAGGDQLF